MSEVKLSVIIVSWRVKDLLLQTIDSLYSTEQNIDFEVIVVDNASNDGSVEAVRKNYPQVITLSNKENLGFAQACWQGVELARGDFFIFLNDDTKVLDNSLYFIIKTLEENENYGVVGGMILNPDETIQPSVRKFPKVKDFLVLLLKLQHLFPSLLNNYLEKNFNYQQSAQVDQVMGAFFGTSRQVWNKLNGFDKNFFIWFEEVDFCLRAKQSGLLVYYQSAAKIIHYRGSSFKQLLALPEQILFNRSLFYYAKKHFKKIDFYFLKVFEPISLFLALLVQILERKK